MVSVSDHFVFKEFDDFIHRVVKGGFHLVGIAATSEKLHSSDAVQAICAVFPDLSGVAGEGAGSNDVFLGGTDDFNFDIDFGIVFYFSSCATTNSQKGSHWVDACCSVLS